MRRFVLSTITWAVAASAALAPAASAAPRSATTAPVEEALSPWVPVRLDLARPTGVCSHGGKLWVAGAGGQLRVSQDHGASFERVSTGARVELFDVHAGDGLIVAVGDGGTIRVSHDDGASWKAPSSNTEAWLDAVWGPPGSDEVFAVGDAGTIVRSLDRGLTWEVVHQGTVEDALADVWGIGGVVFAVGQRGSILRSADHGKSWSAVPSRVGVMLHAVWGPSAKQIYVAGNDRLLLSKDGGRSFRATGRPPGEVALSALIGQGKSLWLAGAGGEVWRSEGGKKWTMERDTSGADVTSLATLGSEVFAIQEGGGLMRRLEAAGDCVDWAPLPPLASCALVQPRVETGSQCPGAPGSAALTIGLPPPKSTEPLKRTIVGTHQLLRYRCASPARIDDVHQRLERAGFRTEHASRVALTASKAATWAEVRTTATGYDVEVVVESARKPAAKARPATKTSSSGGGAPAPVVSAPSS